MKRCTRCILPENAAGIKFGPEGRCQLCREHKEIVPRGEEALSREISGCLEKSVDMPYNCIVPLSGGRDSSYALYYAKKVLGLRPVAVHNDNGFVTETAIRNLAAVTTSLGVPLIEVKSRKDLGKKIVAAKFRINAPFGPGLAVDQTCEACKYGFEAATYNYSRASGIPMVLWGDSADESTVPFHRLSVHKVPTLPERLLYSGLPGMLRYRYMMNELRREYGSDKADGVTELHLYDYIRWDRVTIVKTIKSELGWSVPVGSPTTWRVDCALVPLVNYLTQKAYGVSKLEIGFSTMIRNGKMSRDEALNEVEMIRTQTNEEELKGLLSGIGVGRGSIDALVGGRPLSCFNWKTALLGY
jgi:glucosamine--fructose-6-phosphate aminotransferase (isomerizing)